MLEFKIKRLVMDEAHGNNRRIIVGSDGGFGDFNLSYPAKDAEQFYIGERVSVRLEEVNEHDGFVPAPESDRDTEVIETVLQDVREFIVKWLTDGHPEADVKSCTFSGQALLDDFDEEFAL